MMEFFVEYFRDAISWFRRNFRDFGREQNSRNIIEIQNIWHSTVPRPVITFVMEERPLFIKRDRKLDAISKSWVFHFFKFQVGLVWESLWVEECPLSLDTPLTEHSELELWVVIQSSTHTLNNVIPKLDQKYWKVKHKVGNPSSWLLRNFTALRVITDDLLLVYQYHAQGELEKLEIRAQPL